MRAATDDQKFSRGRIYIGPPDYHLLVKKNHLPVTKGARENRYRPAIDSLFRSAASAFRERVIGVLLTGMLDDGTAGLIAIKKCGGVAVVQDPKDAAYPDMPNNALNNAHVDHCVPLSGMGALLDELTHESPSGTKPVPEGIKIEATIASAEFNGDNRVVGVYETVARGAGGCR